MKNLLLNGFLAIALIATVSSCRDTKEADDVEDAFENAAKETGKAIDDAADATEGALEKAGKAIDEAVEETKEAGEAVDRAIDSVDKSDDN